MFVMEDGSVVYGDCAMANILPAATVPRRAADLIRIIQEDVAPYFEGRDITNFRQTAEVFDRAEINGRRFPHFAVRYGVTQAILEAVAAERKLTMAEVVADEYGLELTLDLYVSMPSLETSATNVDKMILKQVGMMPHGLINNVEEKLGKDGEIFLEWAKWVRDRIVDIGTADYRPVLRYDVYGCIGKAFNNNLDKVVHYLLKVEEVSKPFDVFVEMPIDLKSNEEQLRGMKYLRKELDETGSTLKLIIDEYANTYEEIKEWVGAKGADMIQVKTVDLGGINNIIEAVLYCKKHGVLAYQGGTCNETDKSARVCVNLAVATKPFAMAGKPGMGVDEGVMIVNNEQERLLAILKAKKEAGLI